MQPQQWVGWPNAPDTLFQLRLHAGPYMARRTSRSRNHVANEFAVKPGGLNFFFASSRYSLLRVGFSFLILQAAEGSATPTNPTYVADQLLGAIWTLSFEGVRAIRIQLPRKTRSQSNKM